MPVIEMRPGVYWIGVNDRTTDLFENLWPITGEGVACNAYLIRDGKNAIIDTAKWDLLDSFEFMGKPTKENLKKGEELGEKFAQIIQRA